MARLDHEAGPSSGRQDWRAKRHRTEDTNEALAHALLETVRQALDDGADGTVCATAPHPYGHLYGHYPPKAHHATDAATGAVARAPGVGGFGPLLGYALDPRHLPAFIPGVLWEEAHAFQTGLQPDPRLEPTASRQLLEDAMMPPSGGRSRVGRSATERQRGLEDWSPQPLAARGSLSHDSATTTLNTGEDAADEGRGEEAAAEADAGTADEGGSVPRKKQPAAKGMLPGGPCAHCGIAESPQWRRPLTRKVVLCNACGIYFSRHHSLPKRKKAQMAGAGHSPGAGRMPKPEPASPPKDPAESIICEEELEADDQPAAAAPPPPVAPGRGTRKQGRSAHALRKPDPDDQRIHGGQAVPPGAGATYAEVAAGCISHASEAPLERIVLALPTSPVFGGGINLVVQGFLNRNLQGHR